MDSSAFAEITWLKEWQIMYRHWKSISSNSLNFTGKSDNISIDNVVKVIKYLPPLEVVSSLQVPPTSQPSPLSNASLTPLFLLLLFLDTGFKRTNPSN
jgi:hypothetical protein